MKKTIYIVDDEPKIGELFVTVLNRDGYEAHSFVNPQALLEQVDQKKSPDLILADLMMPGMNGIELIEALHEREKTLPVIIMTAHSSIQTAVDAMRLGAFHYLQKPVNLEEMRTLIAKALDMYESKPELEVRKRKQQQQFPIDGLLGDSEAIARVKDTIALLRDVPNTIVLIRGETGTGKNLVAKTIHYNSLYNAGRFVEINCAALPDNLLEAELFGYEKGAFTDARDAKLGLLEVADGGTLFLDEIDSMSLALQAKLLSFLESRIFRRLGGVEEIRVTTRILCATNAGLEERIAQKEFRRDLFYRINVVNLQLPPLRTMGEDLLKIAEYLLEKYNKEFNRSVKGFSRKAQEKLCAHDWPGNVRELRNVLERAMIFTRNEFVEEADLAIIPTDAWNEVLDAGDQFRFNSGGTLEDLECSYIRHILETHDASYAEVARILGISKKTLWEKRKRYNLDEQPAALEEVAD